MARTKRWIEGPVTDGFVVVRMSSWRYFMDYVYQEMLDFNSYVWRGQRSEHWKLEPTWDRLCRRWRKNPADAGLLITHLDRFKFAARGRRGPNPPRIEDDNDWLALAQHFGLATPLLDWTVSPFVAAYFAYFQQGVPQPGFRSVYALHRPTIVKLADRLKREKETENREKKEALEKEGKLGILSRVMYEGAVAREAEFIRPMSDENQNLINQGGLFSRTPSGVPMEEWIQKHSSGHKGYTLIKILLPDSDRALALRTLNRMNINHSSLFPDLYGASTYTNLFVQIDRY